MTSGKSLEKLVGKTITHDDLAKAILNHNENRDKARALYEFRKQIHLSSLGQN